MKPLPYLNFTYVLPYNLSILRPIPGSPIPLDSFMHLVSESGLLFTFSYHHRINQPYTLIFLTPHHTQHNNTPSMNAYPLLIRLRLSI